MSQEANKLNIISLKKLLSSMVGRTGRFTRKESRITAKFCLRVQVSTESCQSSPQQCLAYPGHA